MTTARIVATIAALTIREAVRRRVLLALVGLTVILIALSGWGFSRLAAEAGAATLTSGEARLTASILLNLVMFGFSLIAALGTAFLAGPTLSGETESGIALAVLARPIRRSWFLLGKWLGLVAFGSGFVVLAGLAQCLVVRATVDYWPPQPVLALLLLAAQTDRAVDARAVAVDRDLTNGVRSGGCRPVRSHLDRRRRRGHRPIARQCCRRSRRQRLADPRAHRRSVAWGNARIPGSLSHRRVRWYGRAGVSVPQRRITHGDVPRVGPDLGRPDVGTRGGILRS